MFGAGLLIVVGFLNGLYSTSLRIRLSLIDADPKADNSLVDAVWFAILGSYYAGPGDLIGVCSNLIL